MNIRTVGDLKKILDLYKDTDELFLEDSHTGISLQVDSHNPDINALTIHLLPKKTVTIRDWPKVEEDDREEQGKHYEGSVEAIEVIEAIADCMSLVMDGSKATNGGNANKYALRFGKKKNTHPGDDAFKILNYQTRLATGSWFPELYSRKFQADYKGDPKVQKLLSLGGK